MTSFSEKLWTLWETYNGFALIAVLFGVLSFMFPWFTKVSYWTRTNCWGNTISINSSPENLYLHELFSSGLQPALFGLLYFLGFLLLLFYCTGMILRNRGKSVNPFDSHSNSFFKVGVIILIIFTAFSFLQFLTPVDVGLDWVSGFTGFAWYWVYGEYWLVNYGFYISVVMISAAFSSYLFEKLMLQKYYRQYLPEFQPRK